MKRIPELDKYCRDTIRKIVMSIPGPPTEYLSIIVSVDNDDNITAYGCDVMPDENLGILLQAIKDKLNTCLDPDEKKIFVIPLDQYKSCLRIDKKPKNLRRKIINGYSCKRPYLAIHFLEDDWDFRRADAFLKDRLN